MAEDREVLREVWQGRIPVAFAIAPEDVTTMAQPDQCYLMVPRMSYFCIVTDKVRKHFSRYLDPEKPEKETELWLEWEGSPIAWHLPVGVLCDQIAASNPDFKPPWNVVVHFGRFPEQSILRFDSREAAEFHFMSCIKEADQIKHGGRVVSTLQKKDHNQLWQGLQNDKFDQFWGVNRKLMEGTSKEDSYFKHIPVRIYRGGDKPMLQKLIKATVAKVMQSSMDGVDLEHQEEKAVQRPATLRDLLDEVLPRKEVEEGKVRLITQGITPELDTPLQWMSEHLSYADNFLHICIQ